MRTLIFLAACIAISPACVQKAFTKTMIITLTVKGKRDVERVGIRGNGNPLSWNTDFMMTPLIKDSVYRAVVVTETAFSSTEIKFTLNGAWELEQAPNRVINFKKGVDTIWYDATFNEPMNTAE